MMVRIDLKSGKLVGTGDSNAPIPHRMAGKPSGSYGKDTEDRKKYGHLEMPINPLKGEAQMPIFSTDRVVSEEHQQQVLEAARAAAAAAPPVGVEDGSAPRPRIVFGRGRGRGRVVQPTPGPPGPIITRTDFDDLKESMLKKPPQEVDGYLWNKWDDCEAFLASMPKDAGVIAEEQRSDITTHLRWSTSSASEGEGKTPSRSEYKPQFKTDLVEDFKRFKLAEAKKLQLENPPILPDTDSTDSEAEAARIESDEEEEDRAEETVQIEMVYKTRQEKEALEKYREQFLQEYPLFSEVGVGLIDICDVYYYDDDADVGTAEGDSGDDVFASSSSALPSTSSTMPSSSSSSA